ncbi:pyrroloquinoline quinone biosynthesis protein PqqB [Shimia thalassica]|uniref:pyrroloquinoline quinone biosynthesis protein PqqB n=1 Tax=Shimia thalassica TaxID=1715693 RepID=UPI000C075D2E|nr:pyrroloquinoline quinone biosynthesis protein PqqB [Shimia thalassica]MDO6800138.1 pyrroloquinoline quinone biosynthesis protein PqqB [Shimia thalassica]PHO05235.1 pyrroloquinoline quinone biosynthesis protein PqqB [Rhodobacteraceae bacterium 4F10]
MRFLVLGAAAGGGLPQWNCGCPNCCDARSGKIESATQSSLAVTLDGKDWAVLNASPDIRGQLQNCPQMHPRSLRDTPLASVLITNGDIDHIAGLLSLREQTPFDLFATSEILDVLAQNRVFDAVSAEKVTRRPLHIGRSFDLLTGLQAQVFPVPGKVPLFMEGAEVKTDLVGEQTVGVRLSEGSKVAYYIPGCAEVTDDLLVILQDADQVFFDGTLWQDDEMIQSGTGVKTGRRMGHVSMNGDDGSIARLQHLGAGKTFIHINNTNPVWQLDGPERAIVYNSGWTVASDGMEIAI